MTGHPLITIFHGSGTFPSSWNGLQRENQQFCSATRAARSFSHPVFQNRNTDLSRLTLCSFSCWRVFRTHFPLARSCRQDVDPQGFSSIHSASAKDCTHRFCWHSWPSREPRKATIEPTEACDSSLSDGQTLAEMMGQACKGFTIHSQHIGFFPCKEVFKKSRRYQNQRR